MAAHSSLDHRSRVVMAVVAMAMVWHGIQVLQRWQRAGTEHHGRDFASYYYAAKVAAAGGNPYQVAELSTAARRDGTRTAVNPYLYPPPFLLAMQWTRAVDLRTAFDIWFWLSELLLLAAALALWRWWRGHGPWVPALIALGVAIPPMFAQNLLMGQANLAVLALVVAGLWQEQRGRSILAGLLLATACIMKMSPALLLLWWLWRRRWRPVLAALATSFALTLLSLPLGLDTWVHFVGDVLPGFATGRYHQLSVPPDIVGNHSLTSWLHLVGLERTPAAVAAVVTLCLAGFVVVGLFRLLPSNRAGGLAVGAQSAAVMVAALLVPVYTYEHHLVWALPAAVMATSACIHGHLGRRWWGPVAIAVAVWAIDLRLVHRARAALPEGLSPLATEAKTAALLVLLFACVVIGRGPKVIDEP